jgi:hypothetical protein
MPSVEFLMSVSKWLIIVVGICLMVFGLFGALANLMIFSRKRIRKTSCAQYILVQSLIDIVIFSFIVFSLVIVNGFAWPFFYFQRLVCVLRTYLTLLLTQASLYCMSLSAFDRWASTSRRVSIRQWSTVKRARVLIVINLVFWVLLCIPTVFLYYPFEVNGIWQCIVNSKLFLNYTSYFFTPCLVLLLPLLSLSLFGFHTYVNLSRLGALPHSLQLERQFTRMIITETLITIVSLIPFTMQFSYSIITADWQKDPLWLATDSVLVQTGRMCYFFNNAARFYIYMCTSSEIRSTLKRAMLKLRVRCRPNRVTTFQFPMTTRNTHR